MPANLYLLETTMIQSGKLIGDIDIDCADREQILQKIEYVEAKKDNHTKHTTGIYVQDVEIDPETGFAADDFKSNPHTKIDLINLNLLQSFKTNNELTYYMNMEPDWSMLLNKDIVAQLPQINQQFVLVNETRPKSIDDLVNILNKIREHSEYKFKRSHATAYALNIIAMMNYYKNSSDVSIRN
jgi:hypothetical protein